MKITLGNVVLAGAKPEENPKDFRLNGQRVIQIAQFLRGETSEPIARGNTTCHITFSVTRNHGSIDAAEKFVLEHDLDVPDNGVLTMEAGAQAKRYAAKCVVTGLEIAYDGSNSFTNYALTTGRMQRNKP